MTKLSNLLFLTFVILQETRCEVNPRVTNPLVLWKFQEPTGSPRISTGQYQYSLIDGNESHLIETVTVPGGAPFGDFAASFSSLSYNNSARLFASRDSAPAITKHIAGVNATVTIMAWVSIPEGKIGEGLVAGVWDEFGVEGGSTGARAYAIFLNLAKCSPSNGSAYSGGLAAHISPVGGPTPGDLFCSTAACDPRHLSSSSWHCLANTYDGQNIRAFVNGTFVDNAARNPFALQGGIFDPTGLPGRIGAEFGVGANRVNSTANAPFHWSNTFTGLLSGVAVWDSALSPSEVENACSLGRGF
jgi:hypothetical protein